MLRDKYQDIMGEAFKDDEKVCTFIVYNRFEGQSVFGGLGPFLDDQDIPDVTIHAVHEGKIVSGNEVVATVTGRFADCIAVESCLLHYLNTVSATATKALEYVNVSNDIQLMDFALRRAPNPMLTSYGCYLAGFEFTSNVDAERYGLTAVGTMSHAWVMAHATEGEAFMQWPHDTYLVDTYDIEQGIENAVNHGAERLRLDVGYDRAIPYLTGYPNYNFVITGDIIPQELVKLSAFQNVVAVGVGTGLVRDLPNIGYVFKLHKYESKGDIHYRQKKTKGKAPSFPYTLTKFH